MFKSFPICFIIYISLKSKFPFYYSIHLIAKYINYILLKHFLTIPNVPFPNNYPNLKLNSLSNSYLFLN